MHQVGVESHFWIPSSQILRFLQTFRGQTAAICSSSFRVWGNAPNEAVAPGPVGEYAQSCLGRERMFEYYSEARGTRVCTYRLNYSIDLRYGVLHDIATHVWNGEPVDVTTGFANVIWQGDACNQVLQSLGLASSPPKILNVTGTSAPC